MNVRTPRIAATTARSWQNGSETRNHITTFKVTGGDLTQVGKTVNLGHAGEQIFAVRYVGDIGYVVTFLQTDPLIAVDLLEGRDRM